MGLPTFPDTITIGDIEYDVSLFDDLNINETDLSGEFVLHAQKFAFYATAYELCLREEKRLNVELERMGARIDYNVRMEAKSGEIRITEKMVHNTVICTKEYIEIEEELQEAQKKTGLLKQAKDAMIHRRDMLVQLGATQRAEGASDISMKKRQYLGE